MRPLALLLILFVVFAVVPATAEQLTVTVIGPDNNPLTGAKIVLYGVSGDKFENTTAADGTAVFNVPNGTYVAVAYGKGYVVLTVLSVNGTTSATINASSMNYANVMSTPLSVEFNVSASSYNYTRIPMTTNTTIYSDIGISLEFPDTIVKFPFKYVLSSIKYDNTTATATTISLDMARNYDVLAVYEKTFYLTLQNWMLLLLVFIVIVAVAAAWAASARAAKHALEEWYEKRRRFVRRRA